MKIGSKVLFSVLAAASMGLAGCGGSGDQSGEPASAEDLAGNWTLVSGSSPDGELKEVVEPISLEFFFEGEDGFSGSAGCNQLFGDVNLEGDGKLKLGPIASTKMMCEEDIMDAEKAYTDALDKVDRASIDDGLLILTGKSTHMQFERAAETANGAEAGSEDTEAIAGDWVLETGAAPTGPLDPAGGEPILLSIESDGSASATVGCNQLGAQVQLTSADTLHIQGTVSTLMACDDELMDLESDYMAALEEVTHYEVADGVLTLSGAETEMTFNLQ